MSEDVPDIRLEEYKTLRTEILDLDKRKNNIIVYTVIATVTLFGFAVEFQSSLIFLLPLVAIIPLGYQVLQLQTSIIHIATYISVVIESQFDELQWETYYKKFRKEFGKEKRLKRQFSNYLLFDLLSFGCILFSIIYFVLFDTSTNSFNPNIISDTGQLILTGFFLAIIWLSSSILLVKWTSQMKECYGPDNQSDVESKIRTVLNLNDEKKTN